jgi:hypothetical protein
MISAAAVQQQHGVQQQQHVVSPAETAAAAPGATGKSFGLELGGAGIALCKDWRSAIVRCLGGAPLLPPETPQNADTAGSTSPYRGRAPGVLGRIAPGFSINRRQNGSRQSPLEGAAHAR